MFSLVQPSPDHLARFLHICRKEKTSPFCRGLQAYMQKCGLESHTSLKQFVIPMLVEAGLILDAQPAFERLLPLDELSWNAIIAGYIRYGKHDLAFNLYHDLQKETCISPSGFTFVALFKTCANLKDFKRTIEIHSDAARLGLAGSDLFVGSVLVDIYAKFGLLGMAQEVFDEFATRDTVLWTALITAYVEHGCGEKSLTFYDQMQSESISADVATIVCILKACGSIGATKKGQALHAKVLKMEVLDSDLFVGSTLVDMYTKCRLITVAQRVFDQLPVRNVVSWTSLIIGYAELGCYEDSITHFDKMQLEGVSPDIVTIVCIIKACGTINAKEKGEEIHAEIERHGMVQGSRPLGNALIEFYSKCDFVGKAQEVFDRIFEKDTDSWNALITGYAENGYVEEAVNCFDQMQHDGISPDASTFANISKAFGSIGATGSANEVLADLEKEVWLRQDVFVGSTLVNTHAKFGSIAKAHQVFDKLPTRNIVSWNALISGYVQHGYCEEALDCLEQMQLEGVSSDGVTYLCALKTCSNMGAIEKGEELHHEIERRGFLDQTLIGNTLVHMYAKCGALGKAQSVFSSLLERTVVSWTALIGGFAECGLGEEALRLLEKMEEEGVLPDVFTYIHGLKACSDIGDRQKAEEIHCEIERRELLEGSTVVGNSLVDTYANFELLEKAEEVFKKLKFADTVSWNTLIGAYVEYECGEEAIRCFEEMQADGVSPDAVTHVCILKACASMGATERGCEIVMEVERQGLIGRDPFLGSTLVDVYAKWGLLEKAQEVFDMLPIRDTVLWNALMSGYAQFSKVDKVFWLFDRMVNEHMKPDPVTFVVLLTACRRLGGLLGRSQTLFEGMSKDYGIIPNLDHHNCMVDVFSRAGYLEKAVSVIRKMPVCPSPELWRTLLGACRSWGSLRVAKQAFDDAVQLDKKDAVPYILLSHIYAVADECTQLGE